MGIPLEPLMPQGVEPLMPQGVEPLGLVIGHWSLVNTFAEGFGGLPSDFAILSFESCGGEN